jgi:hypothetical protein
MEEVMASLTRTELKDIVKECLLEVLLEGIRPNESTIGESTRKQPTTVGKKHLDSTAFGQGASRIAEQAQGRRLPTASSPMISQLAAEFPKEQRGVMSEIFADTARSTFQAQQTAERNPAAAASLISGVPDVDPMSLFEGASGWADLAFATSKK